MNTRAVAVIGAGLIGQSWTALFAAHGYDVIAWDSAKEWQERYFTKSGEALAQLRALGVAGRNGRVRAAETLEQAVSKAFWIQESVPESVPLKLELYKQVETAAPDDAILASSTSSLTWSMLASGLQTPSRFVTAHPFNPPHLMPLVEVFAPSADARETARKFYDSLGRHTVFLDREAVGHIANRLASALWREAVSLVEEGVASVSAIDAALVHGPGLRWSVIGAHMAYHLGGGSGGIEAYLKHLGSSQERRWASLGTPKLTPELSQRIIDGVLEEASGRSISDLEAERDTALLRMLAAKAGGNANGA
ncbi:MAG: 3-hydroxyacyl-CoA dehydrogenase NAD-binding domain-containing protein [Mesorhizobium sp.]